MGIFNLIRKKTNAKALFCGLDNSGKSTIISFLEQGKFIEHTPTMGKTKQDIEIQGTRISMFDMGGQSQFRKMWLGELSKDTKCVVFVIDRAQPDRFDEARAELDNLIPVIEKDGIKLLIFANKSDLPKAVPLAALYDIFNLEKLSSFEILEVSAKTGYGMADAFIKFYSALTGKVLKRSSVAAGISIYHRSGIPIVMKAKNEQDIDKEVVEGGFLSAITSFANMKLGDSCVKIESKDCGTFLVLSSQNFIGALLWDKKLDVPIQESEDSLRDLLSHLETLAPRKDNQEEVSFFVTQYCTNLL
jgi:small GTP-binding protein